MQKKIEIIAKTQEEALEEAVKRSVSYTHLTLPTMATV